uniref:Uncharacterized protein n=1 Tax=Anguilla anguilla TaxID=7936 RepID=A0A0E9UZT4_ANGAN
MQLLALQITVNATPGSCSSILEVKYRD